MLCQHRNTDPHSIMKGCCFADRSHLNAYGRPILGATYRAMPFGPVLLEIHEMAKGEALWLSDLDADSYPWALEGRNPRLVANDPPAMGVLSETDREELAAGFARSGGMNFNERTAATHGPEWQAARLGIMAYEDMIDDRPDRDELIPYPREAAPPPRLWPFVHLSPLARGPSRRTTRRRSAWRWGSDARESRHAHPMIDRDRSGDHRANIAAPIRPTQGTTPCSSS
jgi:hypothetical protein